MDGISKLQNHGLDVASRLNTSGRMAISWLGRRFSGEWPYDHLDGFTYAPERPPEPARQRSWRALWKKIVRRKKRNFVSSTSPSRPAAYDYHTYAQNFDEGSARVEPENLSRSFSSRFAAPSHILPTVG